MRELSIFIDESGDFGKYNPECPFYIISLVMHEQDKSIEKEVKILDDFLCENKFSCNHTIHTAPLIRREKIYVNEKIELRRKIFKKLFNFTKSIDISYKAFIINKKEAKNKLSLTAKIAIELNNFFSQNLTYFKEFDNIIIYYDNGQFELTKLFIALFAVLFGDNYEYRPASQANYKLFQSADLICTLALLKNKTKLGKPFTSSEALFFGSIGKFRKNYLKTIEKQEFENKIINKFALK